MIYYHRRPNGHQPVRFALSGTEANGAGFVIGYNRVVRIIKEDMADFRRLSSDSKNYVKDAEFTEIWAKQSVSSSADSGTRVGAGAGTVATTTSATSNGWNGSFKVDQH